MPISVTAEPIVVTVSQYVTYSKYPPASRDWSLDANYDCSLDDQGIPISTITLHGDWLGRRWTASPILVTTTLQGVSTLGGVWSAPVGLVPCVVTLRGTLSTQSVPVEGPGAGTNWLKWSKIGALDFTIDRSNIAGQCPLPVYGTVYQILRRGEMILVYCKNGVFILRPTDVAFGVTQALPFGLKGKLSIVDTKEAHYFIDTLGRLWKWGEGPQLLDYREWLSALSNPVLSFNPETRLLYLCDGTTGYVYNVDTGSMGQGPPTVTGIGLRDGVLKVVASGTMTVPTFQITTDITDLGSRHGKSISSLEVGIDTTLTMSAAIDFRLKKQSAFSTTGWHVIDSRGLVNIPCYGYEFRFKIKAGSAGWFHIDSLKVNGIIHAH